MSAAGIVLAGGRSSRMGTPKAGLEWHGSTLLRRVAGIVGRATGGPLVVVRAPGQELPPLPGRIEVAEDEREGRGPLQGLAAGLAAVGDRAEVAYVSSTDAPLLHPAPAVEAWVAADRMRPAFLFEECRVRRLEPGDLLADPAVAGFDPELDSVLNLNEPPDYEAARARPAPEVTVSVYGALRRRGAGGREPVSLRAATLGAAAAAVGIELDEHVVAALNGDQITRDPLEPLAEGDEVALMAADAGG